MGISINDLKKVVADAVGEKVEDFKREADKLAALRNETERRLEDLRAGAKAEVQGFWKRHGKVALVAFVFGFALAIVLSAVGIALTADHPEEKPAPAAYIYKVGAILGDPESGIDPALIVPYPQATSEPDAGSPNGGGAI